MKLSAAILVHNNSKTIEKTIRSIHGFVDELVIVDDNSTDNSLQIIKSIFPKAQIFQRKFENNFAEQRNFSLAKCTNDWVLIIDSDEAVSENLKASIKEELKKPRGEVYSCKLLSQNLTGWGKYYLNRPILMQKKLKFNNSIHETVSQKMIKLKGEIYHYSWSGMDAWLDDIKNYSYMKASKWIKENRKYPLFYLFFRQCFLGMFLFFKRFIFEKRFKQKMAGFLYCFTWSFEEFVVALRYIEMRKKK